MGPLGPTAHFLEISGTLKNPLIILFIPLVIPLCDLCKVTCMVFSAPFYYDIFLREFSMNWDFVTFSAELLARFS